MKLTLQQIKDKSPCKSGWEKLLKSKGKTKADEEWFDLMDVLESNGIGDAIWCLRCFNYKDYCLFLADVAESVLHIYEENNNSTAPRAAINAIREYHAGGISIDELKVAYTAAYDAAYDAAHTAAYDAAYTAYAAGAAHTAAYTDADDAAYAAAYADADAAARKNKWAEIEALFIGHFGNKGED